MPEDKESVGEKIELESLQLIGIFLIVFGIIMFVAVYFPKTLLGKVTDLIAGLALVGIGIGVFLKGIAYKRNINLKGRK